MSPDANAKRKKKIVQTDLEAAEYETLAELAKTKNMTIKEVTREALRSWAASATDLSADPIFNLKPVEFKIKVRSDEIEDYLYKRRRIK